MKLLGKKKGILFLLIVGCLFVFLGGCSGNADLTGTWNGKMTVPETGKSLADLEFELTQKGEQLSGAMNISKVNGGQVKLRGTRIGNELKFQSDYKRGLSVDFGGSVQSGSRIKGTALLVYGDPRVPVKQERVTLELSRR